MALVQLSDVIIPAVYNTYTAVDSPETTLFAQSGIAVTNQSLIDAFNGGGNIAQLPFWNDLDDTAEPNYGTDNPADIAVPDKITTGEMITRIVDVNKWYAAANLVADLAGADPVQAIRNRFGVWWKRQFQHRLLSLCSGLAAANLAQNGGDMVINKAIADGNNAAPGNLMSGSAFVDALYSLGDAAGQIVAVAVHSVVMSSLVKGDMIQFFKPSEDAPVIPTLMGKIVIMDDGMPVVPAGTSGYKYTSILFGLGAIGYAEGTPSAPASEVYNQPMQGNGAGVENIGERKRWIMHPFGYKFLSAVVSGQSPTNADMRNASNWQRVVARKNVPITFLITNG